MPGDCQLPFHKILAQLLEELDDFRKKKKAGEPAAFGNSFSFAFHFLHPLDQRLRGLVIETCQASLAMRRRTSSGALRQAPPNEFPVSKER